MNPEEPKSTIPSLEKAQRRYKWKRLLAKKWFFPALYMVVAALIFGIAWWYQQQPFQEVNNPSIDQKEQDEILPVEKTEEAMNLPVKQGTAERTIGFYEESGSKDSKQASLIKYANTYWPHTGVDFARKDGKTFEVVAAMAGKVIRVEENPIVGKQVAIQHDNGLVTIYQSLGNVKVAKGQIMKKGDVIAEAGRNHFEKEAGIHLHFEVHQEQKPVNPTNFLP